MVEVKAGQWWTEKGSVAERHRILVRGLTSGGKRVICEASDGTVSTLGMEYFQKFKEHLPECTSFEWVPEVYPQYRETLDPTSFAFVRLDNPSQYTMVWLNGTEAETVSIGHLVSIITKRTKLTEAEALARIVKPEVKYPIYWTTVDPDEYAYLEQVDAGNVRTVKKDGTPNRPGKASHREYAQRTRLTEEQAKALIKKPEPALRKITLTTYVYGDTLPLEYVGFCITPDEVPEILRSWKYGRILKTEEFEVPCE